MDFGKTILDCQSIMMEHMSTLEVLELKKYRIIYDVTLIDKIEK